MLPDPSEFDDAARLLDQIGSATDQQAGLARERSSSTAWRSGRADRARMSWAEADGLARTAADELRTAARVLRRIADAVNQLAAGMASARAAEMAQLQQARATAVPGGAVAAQLTERIAGLPPAHDASWARQVGAPALALLQVPAHGPGDPGPTTTPGLVDIDPVAVRGLATVWRTASIEIAAGRVRANQRAVSLPLPALDAYGLPGTRAAALVETSLSPASAVARASLSYQSAAEQAVSAADDIDGLGAGFASWVTSAIAAAVDLLLDSARSGDDGRPTLEEILTRFQVRDDPGGSVEWEPSWPVSLTTEPPTRTKA